MRIQGSYESLEIGKEVEILVTEYQENYDRGALSGYPMFAARPE
jgi:hypothetical protein